MTNNSSDEYNWQPLSHEERRRHEILFYSQGPMDGFLPGEHARELFLRSKLPLHILSQIWNLVDQPQDNVLDAAEFVAAVHLIQQTMRGVPLPKDKLPPCLLPECQRSEVRVPTMNKRELRAYKKLFELVDKNRLGYIQSDTVRDVLRTSGLPDSVLAKIWDLSDLDRDGRLSVDEFCIACHLTRYTKKGRIDLAGPVNIYSSLPHRMLKTDLAAKKAKMAELEDLKKRLMAIRSEMAYWRKAADFLYKLISKKQAKKKAEAGRESERAKIWRERFEILQKRHQALREDDVGVNEFNLLREREKLDKVNDIVRHFESKSERLDKEQQQVRKETANVIMEAERLSREVKHLQNEVDKLRENRRRTSQLKDLDPFHQLFEEQKEQIETGVPIEKKEYDIHIPFKTDPFSPRKLDHCPLSGEELFNCSPSDTNSEIEQIFSQNKGSQNSLDPWKSEVSNSHLDQVTFGFEDSFVDAWGHSGSNQNILTDDMTTASPVDDFDFKFTPEDDDEVVFKTISVTEEEDDLWSSLPDSVLATQHETMKYLQTRWALTSERLAQLDKDLNDNIQNTSIKEPEQDVEPSDTSATTWTRIPDIKVISAEDICPVTEDNTCPRDAEELPSEGTGITEGRSWEEVGHSSKDVITSANVKVTEETPDHRCDAEQVGTCISENTVSPPDKQLPPGICVNGVLTQEPSPPRTQSVLTPHHILQECQPGSGESVLPGDNKSDSGAAICCPDAPEQRLDSQTPPSSSQSTPPVAIKHLKPVNGSSESSRESTPLPSSSASPKPPPRSRSLKKKRSDQRQASLDSQTSVQSYSSLKQTTDHKAGLSEVASSKGRACCDTRSSVTDKSSTKLNRPLSPPPKPPPRLKKLKRLSELGELSRSGSVNIKKPVQKETLAKCFSLPLENSVYENFRFQAPDGNKENNTPGRQRFSQEETKNSLVGKDQAENVIRSSDFARKERDNSGKTDHCLAVEIHSHGSNISNGKLTDEDGDNVGVDDLDLTLTDCKDRDYQTDEDMDARSRKQELEKLRSQFFGKTCNYPEGGSTGAPTDLVTAMSDSINQQPAVNCAAAFIQIGCKDEQSRDHLTDSMYGLVRRQAECISSQSDSKTTTTICQGGTNVDGDHLKRTAPVAPPASSDNVTSQDCKTTSRIIVDLDDFSGLQQSDISIGGDDAKDKAASASPQKNTILLDLDEIQIVPDSENKVCQDADFSLIDTTIPASTDSIATTRSAGWQQGHDSDLSDGEGNFIATFVPGAEMTSEWPVTGTLEDDEENEDSGIVLMSYQQKSASPDLTDYKNKNEVNKFEGQGQHCSVSSSGDGFDLLGSLADGDSVDASCPVGQSSAVSVHQSTEGDLLGGCVSAPPAFTHTDTVMTSGNFGDLLLSSSGCPPGSQLASPALIQSPTTEMNGLTGLQPNYDGENVRLVSQQADNTVVVTDQSSPVIKSEDSTVTVSQSDRDQLRLDLNGQSACTKSDQLQADDIRHMDLGRRTNLSPLEKAKMFVGGTEPSYKVKKKEGAGDGSSPLSPEQVALSLELEHERQEILEAVRVRKKSVDKWMPEFVNSDNNRQKTESERKYEERKRRMEKGEEPAATDGEDDKLTPLERMLREENIRSSFQVTGDVDTSSIKDQIQTKQHWEAKLAEQKLKITPKVNSFIKVTSDSANDEHDKESAIEREIRLAKEREQDLKLEHQLRLKEQKPVSHSQSSKAMPIRKVPEPIRTEQINTVTKETASVHSQPTSPIPSGSDNKELPEVTRNSVVMKTETVINKELHQQQEKEKTLNKTERNRPRQNDKEVEQNEFERQDKEPEKTEVHESIVDREIRIQRERELELQRLRQLLSSVKSEPSQTEPEPSTVTAAAPPTSSPERAMASSAEPKSPPSARSETLSYESALSSKSHEGESIIARELREQRQREAELRQRYKEMGLGALLHNDDPPDTPYNAPEPPQPNISKLPARAKATLRPNTGRALPRSASEPAKITAAEDECRGQADNHLPEAQVPQASSQQSASQQGRTEQPRTPKVHPLDEPDLFDTVYKFVPQNETPIEREMRLAREREEELRRARGYPKTENGGEAVIEIKEVPTPVPKPHVVYKKGDEVDARLMQKFASSRLQSEIEKEKKREQDLKEQGKINTLSSERDSGHVKYVEVISKESLGASKQPNWKAQNAAAHTTSPTQSVDGLSNQTASQHNGSATTHQVEPQAREKPEPPVLRRFSTHTVIESEKQKTRSVPNLAESMIEKELREMKEREEELRYSTGCSDSIKLRESISAMQSPDGIGSNSLSNGHEEEKTSINTTETKNNQSSSTVKATRRKSALAEEWERKFGANN